MRVNWFTGTFTLKFTLSLQRLLSGKSAKLCLTLLRMTSGESNSLIHIAGEEGWSHVTESGCMEC